MAALIDAANAGSIDGAVTHVVSNRPDAAGLAYAQRCGIATSVVDHRAYASRTAFEAELATVIDRSEPDLIVLAGFMRILTADFVQRYEGRMLNIHPSLLPAFPGLAAQKQALDWGVKVSGCTVHFVTEGVDAGPIIRQAALPILEEDTEETLAARILMEEHRIYPQALQLYAEKRLTVEGRKVRIRENKSPHGASLLASDS